MLPLIKTLKGFENTENVRFSIQHSKKFLNYYTEPDKNQLMKNKDFVKTVLLHDFMLQVTVQSRLQPDTLSI